MHIAFITHFRPSLLADYLSPADVECSKTMPGRFNSPVANLVPEFINKGHHISIVAAEADVDKTTHLSGPNLDMYFVPHRKKMSVAMATNFRRERRALVDVMRGINPDIVHGQWTQNGHALAALDSGFPCVVTVHDAALTCAWLSRGKRPDRILCMIKNVTLTREVVKRTRYLVAVSTYVEEHLKKVFKYCGDLEIIPNAFCGTAADHQRVKCFDPERPVFIDVAGWGRLKNVKTALKAFEIVRKRTPRARLILYGYGLGASEAGHKWARRRGLDLNVEFRGYATHDVLLKALRDEADIFVHLSLSESFSMTLCEASIVGVPAIVSDLGGMPGVLGGIQGGIFVPPSSMRVVAGQMIQTIDFYGDALSRNRYAQTHIKSEFSPKRIVTLLVQYYEKVLADTYEARPSIA